MPPVLLLFLALLPAGPPRAEAADCIVLEDFSKATPGEFPPGWKLRKDSGKGVYVVGEDGGRRYLSARSEGIGIQAAKEISWDVAAYPVLKWAWRLQEHPRGSDERQSNVWSAVVPLGTALTSSAGLTQAKVVQSGSAPRGEWVEERANVAEDYRARFKESEVPKPGGIAVLTDADDTKSRAAGDYANFRACRS
jgi:hypothetical protein